jgi:hypothetical protein
MEYPISNIKIERVASFDTKKDGSPLLTKAGKPFKKVLLDVDPNCIDDITFTGKLSMLDFDGVADNWKEGDLLTGKIIHDGDYWNFELPRTSARDKIEELESKIKTLEEENKRLQDELIAERRGQITDDDLPF